MGRPSDEGALPFPSYARLPVAFQSAFSAMLYIRGCSLRSYPRLLSGDAFLRLFGSKRPEVERSVLCLPAMLLPSLRVDGQCLPSYPSGLTVATSLACGCHPCALRSVPFATWVLPSVHEMMAASLLRCCIPLNACALASSFRLQRYEKHSTCTVERFLLDVV